MNCSNELGFAFHYERNMQALGLPAPTTIYTSVAAATAAIKSMADTISLYGRTATMGQLAMRATWGYSMAPIVARIGGLVLSVGAAYYVGACVGSVAVAAIKANGCNVKATINDVMSWVREQGINEGWIESELQSNPEILAKIQ